MADDRAWERSYRGRWQHDKVVRSTHGVNCTGSCSWNLYVKEGITTWESQVVDYPSVGPEMPEYEPRGCPRGASLWSTVFPVGMYAACSFAVGSASHTSALADERTGRAPLELSAFDRFGCGHTVVGIGASGSIS